MYRIIITKLLYGTRNQLNMPLILKASMSLILKQQSALSCKYIEYITRYRTNIKMHWNFF